MERIYIATPFAKESKAISLFGSLCSGIAFSTEGVFPLKEKGHDEGGSTIMFLQLFSAYCWTPAKILEYHFRAVCQGFTMSLSPPSTNFLLIGFFLSLNTHLLRLHPVRIKRSKCR